MQYIVCYDIADDQRRSRIAGTLLDFGRRLQESVFVAFLEPDLLDQMKQRLEAVIDREQDSICIFSLCNACGPKAITMGVAEIPLDKAYYIV